ncbi:uncharacterized protein [Clytia hemisphaerica]|uniref:Thioredoxin domain-containing protein n=1 Tax=Clytia hemisphaerica TaxID=252671 RepID=A0A7M5WKS0_9CNID|eukprot:TCONS_00024688-protein
MKHYLNFTVLLLALASISAVPLILPGVVDPQTSSLFNKLVTKNNFDTFTKKKPIMVIMFFKSWCPYVKRFLPEWKKATETLEKQGKYILARSDCDGTGKTLCDHRDIQVKQVPTVLLFKNGKRVSDVYCGTKDAVFSAASVLKSVDEAKRTDDITGVCTAIKLPAPTTTTVQPKPNQGQNHLSVTI